MTVHCGIGDGYLHPYNFICLVHSWMGEYAQKTKAIKYLAFFFKNSAGFIWDGLTLSHSAVLAAQCLVSQLRWGI